MKQWILALTIIMGTSLAMAAGTFKADDFNQMIKENQKIENDLRSDLQKEAGIVLDDKIGHVAEDKIIRPETPEEVVVSSSQLIWTESKAPIKARKALQKEQMKRISQELEASLKD